MYTHIKQSCLMICEVECITVELVTQGNYN